MNTDIGPDWVSPPGDTIADVLEERGWTQAELARRLGYTEKHVSQLINGKAAITEDTASRLERVLGSTAGFWLRKEATYRERLERQQFAQRCMRYRMNRLCPRGIELDKALAEAYRAWWAESRKPNPKPLLKHHRETAKNNAKNALVTHLNCCAACKTAMEEIA